MGIVRRREGVWRGNLHAVAAREARRGGVGPRVRETVAAGARRSAGPRTRGPVRPEGRGTWRRAEDDGGDHHDVSGGSTVRSDGGTGARIVVTIRRP